MAAQVYEGRSLFLIKEGLQGTELYQQNFIDLIVLLKTVFIRELIFKNNLELGRAELCLGNDVMLTIRLGKTEEAVSVLVETALALHYDFMIRQAAEGAKLKLIRLLPLLELTQDMEVPRDR